MYEPLNTILALYYQEHFLKIPDFYQLLITLLLDHKEFILASEALEILEKIEPLPNNIHRATKILVLKTIEETRWSGFPKLSNNYEDDEGISVELFEVLNNLNLAKVSKNAYQKIFHPFGSDQAPQESPSYFRKRMMKRETPQAVQKKRFSDLVHSNGKTYIAR